MDYSDSAKYFFFRLILLFGTNAAGVLLGKMLPWCLSNLLPASLGAVKQALVSDALCSMAAAAVMILLLGFVFHDDARRHAAYDNMDAVPVAVVLILMLVFYFVPVVFYDPMDISRAGETLYGMLYFPTKWLREIAGMDIKTAAALGMAMILGIQMMIYQVTYSAYKRKHPFLFLHENSGENGTDESIV
ncbi:MAG: hypothetical protein J6M17_14090 [Ruminococcus sp.]|nr:hypothetical protein [Ruminococcus sp.]